jgi:hypothetical protein
MTSITEVEAPTLTALLTELAVVFQSRDDAIAAAEYANGEVERLQAQYAEVCEDTFTTIQGKNQVINKVAGDVCDRNLEIQKLKAQLDTAREHHDADQAHIRDLQGQLDVARRSFGDAFLHGDTGPTRKNRPKLTPAEVGGIRSMVRNGSTRAAVAALYGVHPTTVSRIASGTYHREEPA